MNNKPVWKVLEIVNGVPKVALVDPNFWTSTKRRIYVVKKPEFADEIGPKNRYEPIKIPVNINNKKLRVLFGDQELIEGVDYQTDQDRAHILLPFSIYVGDKITFIVE